MNVAALTAFLRSTLAEEQRGCFGEPWWDYHSGPEPVYRQEPMREEQEKVAAQLRIVDWCVEVIGDRDLSRYGEFAGARAELLGAALRVRAPSRQPRGHAGSARIGPLRPL